MKPLAKICSFFIQKYNSYTACQFQKTCFNRLFVYLKLDLK